MVVARPAAWYPPPRRVSEAGGGGGAEVEAGRMQEEPCCEYSDELLPLPLTHVFRMLGPASVQGAGTAYTYIRSMGNGPWALTTRGSLAQRGFFFIPYSAKVHYLSIPSTDHTHTHWVESCPVVPCAVLASALRRRITVLTRHHLSAHHPTGHR